MPVTAVIGGQWGDEGKGKLVDLLCEDMDVVARYQGGANAGHTVKIDSDTIILHQVPSGILRPDCICILGHGMVVDPSALSEELDALEQYGISTDGRIQISYTAHIVTPIHKAMDRATGHIVGTTLRGIGPAYADKARRLGIQAVDMLDITRLGQYLIDRLKIGVQQGEFKADELDAIRDEMQSFLYAADRLAPMLTDTIASIHQAMDGGKNILIEGAQGTLLDLDMGTYPFVTSSHPTVGGIAAGLGFPVKNIDRLMGVFKAYTTRVGEGPFPTELNDEVGERLQEQGAEFGATTGRKRRCGWFDAVAAAYACRINGFTELALTKLDVLDKFDSIKVCTAYELDGDTLPGFSAAIHQLDLVKPVYTELPGWRTDTSDLKSAEALPTEARDYIQRLEELVQVPFVKVSIGAERSQILTL
ncbi:MAG: adenylosuccinate synthase [Fidelibacterota bacterium]|nr:MAG: adenylosuccinate synthase [Candidatus Neomarinimicrobiota bacterium]